MGPGTSKEGKNAEMLSNRACTKNGCTEVYSARRTGWEEAFVQASDLGGRPRLLPGPSAGPALAGLRCCASGPSVTAMVAICTRRCSAMATACCSAASAWASRAGSASRMGFCTQQRSRHALEGEGMMGHSSARAAALRCQEPARCTLAPFGFRAEAAPPPRRLRHHAPAAAASSLPRSPPAACRWPLSTIARSPAPHLSSHAR